MASDFTPDPEKIRKSLRKLRQDSTSIDQLLELVTGSNMQAGSATEPTVRLHFKVIAEACEMVHFVLTNPVKKVESPVYQCFCLLAEAQCSLRQVLLAREIVNNPVQLGIYDWLRSTKLYFARFMKSDPCTTRDVQTLLDDILMHRQSHKIEVAKHNRVGELFAEIRDLVGQILDEPDHADGYFFQIDAAVRKLFGYGISHSDAALRSLMLPVIDKAPAKVSPQFAAVLRAGRQYLATRCASCKPVTDRYSSDVERVRGWLEGKELTIIGGELRDDARQRVIRAFGLNDCHWVATNPHDSYKEFRPFIERPAVKVVLLVIGLTSYSFGNASALCVKVGKPFVRLPAGYGVNQIAHQIMVQCSNRLGGEA